MRALCRKGLTAFLLLAGLLPAESLALDRGLKFLLPEQCLPADGGPPFDLHVYVWPVDEGGGRLELEAGAGSFGRAREIEPGLFAAAYTPAKLPKRQKIVFSGKFVGQGFSVSGRNEVTLCPHPVGRVEVRARPDSLLAGEGQQSRLKISVFDSEDNSLSGVPLEITTNVGQVNPPEETGDGKYEAVFLPPDDPFPQVASIMVANPRSARLDRVAVGRAVIPITARIELPGKTARGTSMEMTVAGRKFGPVRADEKGEFKIPILVPPGYGRGKATSIDRVGNRKSRWVDLFLPETNQLSLWAYPRELRANGNSRARLLATTIDRYGAVADVGGVGIKADKGSVGRPRRISRGLFEAYYTAPGSVGEGFDLVHVTFPGGGSKSRAQVRIHLLPGPAARISLDVPESLPADGKTQRQMLVRVEDAHGNPVGGKKLAVTAGILSISEAEEIEPGVHRSRLTAGPDPAAWKDEIRVTVREKMGKSPDHVLVSPASLRADTGKGYMFRAALVDMIGRPVAGIALSLRIAGARLVTETDELGAAEFDLPARVKEASSEAPAELQLSAAGFITRRVYLVKAKNRAMRLLPYKLDEALVPEPFEEKAGLLIHPPPAVRITLETVAPSGGGHVWRIRARLAVGPGKQEFRRVVFSASAGKLLGTRRVEAGLFEARLDPGPAGWGRIIVTATETIDHVSAIGEIREPGRKD